MIILYHVATGHFVVPPGFAVAYALSPLDLVPDFIPVLGVIDDIIILPVLLWVALKLIPQDVWARAKERADLEPVRLADNWAAAIAVFILWDATCLLIVWLISRNFGSRFTKEHLWLPMVVSGCLLVFAEAVWSVWVLFKERRWHQSVSTTPTDPLLFEPANV